MTKLTLEERMALNPIPTPKYDSRSERISKLYLSLRDSLYYDIDEYEEISKELYNELMKHRNK